MPDTRSRDEETLPVPHPAYARTLTEEWVDRHRAALLAQLEWELDAGWRTVTDVCPQPVDEPVHGPGHPVRPVLVHLASRPYLRVVA